MFFKILLPGSVPFIATGLRFALQRAVVAVIVAEFLVGVPGVGFIIREARAASDADRLFAMALLLMGLGLRHFSLSPIAIPTVKRVIRQVTMKEAVKVADECLNSEQASESEELLSKRVKKLLPDFF